MKKFLVLFMALGLATFLVAQDPVKDIKKAARLLGTYNLDQAASADKLQEAISLANASIDDPMVKNDPSAWQTYGEIFMAAVDNDVKTNVVDNAAVISQPSAPAKAFKGFSMAASLADKGYQTKDAMKALSSGIQNIYYMGSALYQAGDYASAYEAFKATYDGYSLLEKNKEPTTFSADEHPKALYYSGLCAQQAGMNDKAKVVFRQLVDEGIAEPEVYDALYSISINEYIKKSNVTASNSKKVFQALVAKGSFDPNNYKGLFENTDTISFGGVYRNNSNLNKEIISTLEKDKANVEVKALLEQLDSLNKSLQDAVGILNNARSKFPDDAVILFAETNYLIGIGEHKKAISNLEKAIQIDSNNASVYLAMGQLYDKMFQDSVSLNPFQAEESFWKAMEYYIISYKKDHNNFDAIYSIGAIWYNKAASYSVELNNFSSDYSPAGNKKYEAKKAQMDEAFDTALPFFQYAEYLNPKDINTLIALKEIYARKEKFDLVEIYKQRLENPDYKGGPPRINPFLNNDQFPFNNLNSEWIASGTGFFIDARGYLATNYHVVKGAHKIEVDLFSNNEKRSYNAKVVKFDVKNDLAILKIDDANFKPFPKLPYNLKTVVSDVGTVVNVLGYPMALMGMGTEVKYTDGKISSKTGYNDDVTSYQISVPVQPGNSGGPLYDNGGNIIGIVNAKIILADNVTYAIKASYLKSMVDAFPDELNLPNDTSLGVKIPTEQIKILSPYVVLIKKR